jgi:hypothetical protein
MNIKTFHILSARAMYDHTTKHTSRERRLLLSSQSRSALHMIKRRTPIVTPKKPKLKETVSRNMNRAKSNPVIMCFP